MLSCFRWYVLSFYLFRNPIYQFPSIYQVILVVTLCTCITSTLFSFTRGRTTNWPQLKARFVKLFSMLLSFVYFSVVLVDFQIYGCSETDHKYYINLYPLLLSRFSFRNLIRLFISYPWLKCGSNLWYYVFIIFFFLFIRSLFRVKYAIIASLTLATQVILFPAVLMYKLYSSRNSLNEGYP